MNVGVALLFTETIIVAVDAHWPAVGAKVYVVVAVLFTDGFHVPVTPFVEVVGNVNDPPVQIAGTCVNIGVTLLFTETVIVAFNAHCPVVGIKVYVVVAVLFTTGLHVPVIPLVEVVGNVNEPPGQIAAIWVNDGATGVVTFIAIVLLVTVATEAHDALLVITTETTFPLPRVVVV